MEIKETTIFNFTFTPDGISYNFNISAANQQEACEKLLGGLAQIVSELQEVPRATKPH